MKASDTQDGVHAITSSNFFAPEDCKVVSRIVWRKIAQLLKQIVDAPLFRRVCGEPCPIHLHIAPPSPIVFRHHSHNLEPESEPYRGPGRSQAPPHARDPPFGIRILVRGLVIPLGNNCEGIM